MEQRIFENNFPMRSALKLPCLNFASGFSQERRWQAQLWPAAMTQNFMGKSTDQNPVIVSLWKLIIIRTKIIWGIFHVWFSNAVMIHKVHILHHKSAKWIIVSDHNSAFHLLFTLFFVYFCSRKLKILVDFDQISDTILSSDHLLWTKDLHLGAILLAN